MFLDKIKKNNKKRKIKPKHFCNTQDTNAVLLLGESGNEAQRMHEAEK